MLASENSPLRLVGQQRDDGGELLEMWLLGEEALAVPGARARAVDQLERLGALTDANVVDHARFAPMPDGTVQVWVAVAEGRRLADALAERGAMRAANAIALLRPLALALDRLHAHGIVHGRISPAAVQLGRAPRWVDFSLGLVDGPFDAASDLRAFGRLARALLIGRPAEVADAALPDALMRLSKVICHCEFGAYASALEFADALAREWDPRGAEAEGGALTPADVLELIEALED